MFQEVYTNCEAVEGDLHLSEGFEVEGIEVHEVDEHAAAEADQRGVDRHVLHRVYHGYQKGHKADQDHHFCKCAYTCLQPLNVAVVDGLYAVLAMERVIEIYGFSAF
jgi:hypothetical protein